MVARVAQAVLALALAAGAGDVGARSYKGDGPTTIGAGAGSVWLGTGRGEVVRIDASDGRVRDRFLRRPAPSFVSDLVVAYGAVWLGDSSRPLARLDPRTGRIEEVPASGARTPGPGPVAAGAGAVWSGDWRHRRVFRIRPDTVRVASSAAVPGRIVDLAAGGAGAYVVYAPRGIAGPRVLRRLDAKTARAAGPAVRFRCDIGVAVGGSALWTIDYCTWKLTRRDPRTLRVQGGRPVPRLATNVTLAHGSVWLAGGSRLLRVDPRTLRTIMALWVPAADVAVTADGLWLLDLGDGRTGIVRRLDPRTNRIVAAVRIR